jgi:hypothetical protein
MHQHQGQRSDQQIFCPLTPWYVTACHESLRFTTGPEKALRSWPSIVLKLGRRQATDHDMRAPSILAYDIYILFSSSRALQSSPVRLWMTLLMTSTGCCPDGDTQQGCTMACDSMRLGDLTKAGKPGVLAGRHWADPTCVIHAHCPAPCRQLSQAQKLR